jgi:hypothetical protein
MTSAQEWVYWLFKRHYGNDIAMQYFFILATRDNVYEAVPNDYEPPF